MIGHVFLGGCFTLIFFFGKTKANVPFTASFPESPHCLNDPSYNHLKSLIGNHCTPMDDQWYYLYSLVTLNKLVCARDAAKYLKDYYKEHPVSLDACNCSSSSSELFPAASTDMVTECMESDGNYTDIYETTFRDNMNKSDARECTSHVKEWAKLADISQDNCFMDVVEQFYESFFSIHPHRRCSCIIIKVDCQQMLQAGYTQSGVYTISVTGKDLTPVWCDMETDGGGWTVFQRRIDNTTDFYRDWAEYRDGFGDAHHDYWLGNDKLHLLTSPAGSTELRIDMGDFEGHTAYAKYSSFSIGDAHDKYRLTVSGYTGTAGDSFAGRHSGHRFYTKDDDDTYGCSVVYHGAWWYNTCHDSNLNGEYLGGAHSAYARGVVWDSWKGYLYSLKSTKMMIRKVVK
ncbi:microfibril-associated glycoprotein 4-like isoform X1 [Argopecten irradians]|uniref:microfibril-associated glycoprotein 4-like isoform X1 n=1 Tax=Argopecten irradians TaxID=31199 RepID=UPI00371777BE